MLIILQEFFDVNYFARIFRISLKFLTETHCVGFFSCMPNFNNAKIIRDKIENLMEEETTFSK